GPSHRLRVRLKRGVRMTRPRPSRVKALALSVAAAVALLPAVTALLAAPAGAQAATSAPPDAAKTWYFAEGNTLPGWYEFLVMINPNPNRDITVTVTYQLEEPAGVSQGTKSNVVGVPAG